MVGEHPGYAGFTVGQRKGLPGGFPEAMFVIQIRPDSREVVVGPRSEMLAREVEVRELNWLAQEVDRGEELQVQLRYRARPAPARVEGLERGTLRLSLLEPQFAVTPGQSAVLFSGERVLGGGRIRGGGGGLSASARPSPPGPP